MCQIKKLRNITMFFVTVLMLATCTEKAPVYPDLEGFWKQEQIEVRDGRGTVIECNRLFWAFQLGVAEIKDLGNNGYGTCLCRFEYDEGKSLIRMYDFVSNSKRMENSDVEILKKFGIPSLDVTYKVLDLDGDRMILCVGDTVLYYRSF